MAYRGAVDVGVFGDGTEDVYDFFLTKDPLLLLLGIQGIYMIKELDRN